MQALRHTGIAERAEILSLLHHIYQLPDGRSSCSARQRRIESVGHWLATAKRGQAQ
jgi:hypothetical protein